MNSLAVRWTVGDVSRRGYEALALSIRALTNLVPDAAFVVSVNSLPVSEARRHVGEIADRVDWLASDGHAPEWLDPYLHDNFAEGVAWKFAPVRLYPDRHELSIDNDVVLWDLPLSLQAWLDEEDSCLIAEDVAPAFGQFWAVCGAKPRNSGIRGLPPRFDMEGELRRMLRRRPVVMNSELDEQGLQVAVVTREKHHVVSLEEVTICSPFAPHLRNLGRFGAHFVGLNANDRSSQEHVYANWDGWKPEIESRVHATGRSTLELLPESDALGDLPPEQIQDS